MSFSGVYPITDDAFMNLPGHEEILGEVAGAGIAMLQFRAKHGDRDEARRQAARLLAICRRHEVPLILNDDVELCAQIGADGVHLGRADRTIADVRSALGAGAIIGATCHDSLELARSAQVEGADYVAFGRFFPSTSKPEASPARLETLRAASETLDLPVAAIGGIRQGNALEVLSAGADLLAVINAIFGAPDPAAAARNLVRIQAEYAGRETSPQAPRAPGGRRS